MLLGLLSKAAVVLLLIHAYFMLHSMVLFLTAITCWELLLHFKGHIALANAVGVSFQVHKVLQNELSGDILQIHHVLMLWPKSLWQHTQQPLKTLIRPSFQVCILLIWQHQPCLSSQPLCAHKPEVATQRDSGGGNTIYGPPLCLLACLSILFGEQLKLQKPPQLACRESTHMSNQHAGTALQGMTP